ncbi:MAG: sensor histidine kinase [Planctomycetota bacterium]|nr:MAG: sensor histidine kinase [Planctomycetota bacterium]
MNVPAPDASESPQQIIIRLQRKALLGDLAAVLVHEFNNLMTSALARVDFALMTGEEQAARKALETMHKQAHAALQIARKWVDLGQGGAPELTRAPLENALDDALTTLARPLEKDGLELRRDIDGAIELQADGVLLRQFLMNVLHLMRGSRAERGGRLTIEARRDDDARATIALRGYGCGLDAETARTSIAPYLASGADALDAADESTPLELIACRLIAEWHSAALRCEADDDCGVRLIVRWPTA